jgi:hypothetical protein
MINEAQSLQRDVDDQLREMSERERERKCKSLEKYDRRFIKLFTLQTASANRDSRQ